jgi:hypothetical protein
MSTRPDWVAFLAPHTPRLTEYQVARLEALRKMVGYPEDTFHLALESFPPWRRAGLRRLYDRVVAMTPSMAEEFYTARMTIALVGTHQIIRDYVQAVERGESPDIPVGEHPTGPPMPPLEMIVAVRPALMRAGRSTVRGLVEGVLADEAIERAASDSNAPTQQQWFTVVFEILAETTLPEPWPEWSAPDPVPEWRNDLASHIALADDHVARLEALRRGAGQPHTCFRLLIEDFGPFRRLYFRRLLTAITATSPGRDDGLYLEWLACAYFGQMGDAVHYFRARDSGESRLPPVPRMDAPRTPQRPSSEAIAVVRPILEKAGHTTIRAFVEAYAGTGYDRENGTRFHRQFIEVTDEILSQVQVADSWPEWT